MKPDGFAIAHRARGNGVSAVKEIKYRLNMT